MLLQQPTPRCICEAFSLAPSPNPLSLPCLTTLLLSSQYPASAGKLETIRALLKQGANANAQDDAGGHAVLRCADKGDDASIKVLLDEGKANIDLAAKSGSTALHIACMRGHTGKCPRSIQIWRACAPSFSSIQSSGCAFFFSYHQEPDFRDAQLCLQIAPL